MDENKKMNIDENSLKEIEKAAERGAKAGIRKSNLLSVIIPIVIVAVLAVVIVVKVNAATNTFESIFNIEESVEGYDLTIDNKGIFGYTAADFSEAILGNSEKLKKIEVYQQEIQDIVCITNAGLFKLGAFTKAQYLTYHGSATYTVDLSKLSAADITLDAQTHTVTMLIPHAEQEEINIPEDKIEFGDVQRGVLAFGEITMTAEDSKNITAGVREKMEEELEECNALETADRMAVLTVWEMYSPMIKAINSNYTLEVEIK